MLERKSQFLEIYLINNQIPITFEEPEIEPAKEDLKLNLEIKDNINDSQTNKKIILGFGRNS